MRRPSVQGGVSIRHAEPYHEFMRNLWGVLVILLVVWAILSVVGFVFKGLLWLAIIGIVLFVGTLIFGAIRSGTKKP